MHVHLRNDRGAVFLLAVYLVAFTVLLLGGVSLQRTTTEVRASQLSRDLHQAFWLAESGLDNTIEALRLNPLLTDAQASHTYSFGGGTVTVSVRTPPNALQADGRELRRLTITGTSTAGVSQRIRAVLALEGSGAMPFREGLFAQNTLFIGTKGTPQGIMKVKGPVGSSNGAMGSAVLVNAQVDGPVLVGSSGAASSDSGYRFIGEGIEGISTPDWNVPYASGLGDFVPGIDGYGLSGSGIQTVNTQLEAPPIVANLAVPSRPDLAAAESLLLANESPSDPDGAMVVPDENLYPGFSPDLAPAACTQEAASVIQGHLRLEAGETLTVTDGGIYDRDPAEGKILTCWRSVYLGQDSHLVFTAPATIYLAGGKHRALGNGEWYTVNSTKGAYVQQAGTVVEAKRGDESLRNGVELIVPWWRATSDYTLVGLSGTFRGSIWAPGVQSPVEEAGYREGAWVFMGDELGSWGSMWAGRSSDSPLVEPPVRVFAEMIHLYSKRNPPPTYEFRSEAGDGAPYPRDLQVSLVNWRLSSLDEAEDSEDPDPVGSADPINTAIIISSGKSGATVTHQ